MRKILEAVLLLALLAVPAWAGLSYDPNAAQDSVARASAATAVSTANSASSVAATAVSTANSASSVAATASASELGLGQTWQVVTGSRVAGTVYTNSTARPIVVNAQFTSTVNATAIVTVAGVVVKGSTATSGLGLGVCAIVPPGATYSATADAGTPALQYWAELR